MLPKTMRTILVPTPGPAEVLALAEAPVPVPRAGEVLIRVAAAGVNGPDLAQRRGLYDPPPGASPVPGLEVAGIVAAAGPDVTAPVPGARVMALTNGGGYAEYVAVPAGQVLPVPDHLDLAIAAALPETWFTVTQTLVMRAGLVPGMVVLVHGAAGGIGGAAVVIARQLGARVLAVVSSDEKAAYALALGAEAAIVSTREDFVARTRELTGGHGADRIVDIAGGAVTAGNVEAAARGGHIVLIATQGGGTAELPLARVLHRQLTLSGSTLRPQSPETKAAIAARIAADLLPALREGDIALPRVTRFAFADAPSAHRALEERSFFGKAVLVTPFGSGL